MRDPEETAKRIRSRAQEHAGFGYGLGYTELIRSVSILMAQEARKEALMHSSEQLRAERHRFWNEVIYYIRGVQE